MGSPISCVLEHANATYVASGSEVTLWKRGKRILAFPVFAAPITCLVMFGDHLMVLTSDNVVTVIDPKNQGWACLVLPCRVG